MATDARVETVERTHLRVPFREVPGRNMDREIPHWRHLELTDVTLADGTRGIGETTPFYTWGRTTDAAVERVRGANAASLLWDDSLGAGLQMALSDAVGRSLGVPVADLLGGRVRERVPVSWWCIDMPPEDLAAEAERAAAAGYTDLKTKGRPWYDVEEQLDALAEVVPEDFAVDLDFNGTLLDAERARPVLEAVERRDFVETVEEPIEASDLGGNRRIREDFGFEVALHAGRPPAMEAIRADAADGFVVTGGASEIRDLEGVAGAAGRPFWLQLVGSGVTAAFALQAGAACEAATWPAVTCREVYEHDLLAADLDVREGAVRVPEGPGLGVDLDREAVAEYEVDPPEGQPYPERLVEVEWPDGPTMYFAGDDGQLLRCAMGGGMPYFESGVETRLVPDDGSDWWRETYERARESPVRK